MVLDETPAATILKMNFNFNFKDMLSAPNQSMQRVTNVRHLHRTAKISIEPSFEP